MYTKLEIVKIFSSVHTAEELNKVLEIFCWLIVHEFQERNMFLHSVSTLAFRRINNLDSYED